VQRSFGSGGAASTKNVEIISKSDPEVQCSGPEVQRSFNSRSTAFVQFQKCSVHSGPEVQRSTENSFNSRSAAFIQVRKCSVRSIPEVQRSFGSGSAASTKNVEIISKSHPEVQRSFDSGSAASTKNVEIISKSDLVILFEYHHTQDCLRTALHGRISMVSGNGSTVSHSENADAAWR
jgi:hypothetical protein